MNVVVELNSLNDNNRHLFERRVLVVKIAFVPFLLIFDLWENMIIPDCIDRNT